MRDDFNYINNATAICLWLTEMGVQHIEQFVKNPDADHPLEDLMIFIETSYACIDDDSTFDLGDIYDTLVSTYKGEFGVEVIDCREAFKQAMCTGLIGFKKIIWG